jgi:hypothetical protein
MESKKINQLATNLLPVTTDLTVIGNPTTGELKKITLAQIAALFGAGLTSVGMVVPSGLSVSPATLTSSGTFTISGAGTTAQYIRGDGSLATFPSLTGYVPYTGATGNINLNTNYIYANAFYNGFISIAASGTQYILTINSVPEILVTGSGGQTIKLPDATTLTAGTTYSINNNQSSGAVLVNNNSSTLVVSIPSGGYAEVILIDNTTAAGTWDRHFQAPANVSWSTNTFDYGGSITSATWNGLTIQPNRGGTGQSTYTDGQLLIGNSTGNTLSKSTLTAGTGISITNGSGTITITNTSPSSGGTVTSVAALTLGTTGTDLSSTVATGTTTPVITLNVPTASASNRGALSSTDWSTFNSKQSAITLTTTGSSGASTFVTGTLNVPTYTLTGLGGQPLATNLTSLAGLTFATTSFVKMTAAGTFALDTTVYTSNTGTVTSVSMTVPTGLTIGGSPITTSGTLAVTFTAGYSIPTTASQTTWDTAYTNRITSLTTTGSSGSATLVTNTLNIPTYTLAGLGGQASSTNLTSLAGLTYVSASFVKMTASGTFSLDTSTYLTANQSITLSGDISGTGTTAITTAIGANKVTNAMLSQIATSTFLGRVTAATGNVETLTGTQATTLLDVFSSTLKGLTPSSGGGTTNFLRADGTWAAPATGGTGTVTSVSVVSANGFTGTVATATTTPAITLTTSITGLLKGNGTAISAATSGTDYQAPSTNLTSLSGLTYVSASFVKMTAAGTFTLDTSTYYLASNPSGYTNNTGTVTSVAALTLGTTGTDLSSTVATGTTTPVITLNVPTASAANRGALSSTDWSTFNGKQAGSASLTSLSGLTFVSTSFVKMTATGTFALDTNTYLTTTSAGTTYVPYTGATGTVNLGSNSLQTTGTIFAGKVDIAEAVGISSSTGFTTINANTTYFAFARSGTQYAQFNYDVSARSYTLPSSNGTIALTSDIVNQTITLSGDISGSGTTAITTAIGTNKVTNAMLAQVATASFLGRVTAATGNVETLTATQATSLLNNFSSTLKGLVPLSGGGTTNFLRADGTWAAPSAGSTTNIYNTDGTLTANRTISAGGFTLSIAPVTTFTSTPLTLSTSANSIFTINGGSASTTGIIFQQAGTEVGRISFSASLNKVFSIGAVATTYLTISSTGSANFSSVSASDWAMQVANTGVTNANGLYVNIGATSTGVPFRVDKGGTSYLTIANTGIASFSQAILSANTYGANLTFTDTSSNTGRIGIIRNTTSGNGAFFGADGIVEFYTNMSTSNVKALSLSTTGAATFSGNVGIGTIPGTSRLLTQGIDTTSSNYAFVVQNSTPFNLFTIRNDGLTTFGSSSSSTALMTLTNDGHLLIGTTTNSTYLLDVNGSINLTGSLNTGVNTTSLAAIDFTVSGSSLKTSPIAGDMEVDANGISYYTHNTSERGIIPSQQFITITSAYTFPTSITTAQKIFNAPTNGTVTVKASTTYFFECSIYLTNLSATTTNGWFGFALGGTATFTSLVWHSIAQKATTSTTPAAPNYTLNVNPSNANISNPTGNAGTIGYATITGMIRINAAGTIIPQVLLGVGALATVTLGSYFKITAAGTSSVQSVGNWS